MSDIAALKYLMTCSWVVMILMVGPSNSRKRNKIIQRICILSNFMKKHCEIWQDDQLQNNLLTGDNVEAHIEKLCLRDQFDPGTVLPIHITLIESIRNAFQLDDLSRAIYIINQTMPKRAAELDAFLFRFGQLSEVLVRGVESLYALKLSNVHPTGRPATIKMVAASARRLETMEIQAQRTILTTERRDNDDIYQINQYNLDNLRHYQTIYNSRTIQYWQKELRDPRSQLFQREPVCCYPRIVGDQIRRVDIHSSEVSAKQYMQCVLLCYKKNI
eukprot:180963_1